MQSYRERVYLSVIDVHFRKSHATVLILMKISPGDMLAGGEEREKSTKHIVDGICEASWGKSYLFLD